MRNKYIKVINYNNIINNIIKMMNNKIKQRTPEWYTLRKKMITASNVASILGYNPYDSKVSILKKKVNNVSISNAAMAHGVKYEPLAIKEYEKKNKCTVDEVGLLVHPTYNWLGASPDGFIISTDKLLEIKCVYTRDIHIVPYYYWIQVQIQLEVCNKEVCDFFQCKFEDSKLVDSTLDIIKRDRDWFVKVLPELKSFQKDLLYCLKKNKVNFKRKRFYSYVEWENYICSHDIKNYIKNDPILNYLSKYGDSKKKDEASVYNKYISDSLKTIRTRIFKSISYSTTICVNKYLKNYESIKRTKDAIDQKVIVIIRPLLVHANHYSIPDMLVRNDFLEKLFNIVPDKLDTNYSIVQITFKKLTIKNNIIQKMDKAVIAVSYLDKCICDKVQKANTSVYLLNKQNKIGKLITDDNSKLLEKIARGVEWLTELIRDGEDFDVLNPDRWELYPNMCNHSDYGWHSYKKELADNANELTTIWNIGINKRKELHHKGIYRWDDVEKEDVPAKVFQIIKVNKSRKKYMNVVNSLPQGKKYFFVDFETVNNLSTDNFKANSLIYIIGCGYIHNNKWKFKQFKLNTYDLKEEKDMILKWINFMYGFKKEFLVCHWCSAEKTFFRQARERHSMKYNPLENNFFDLCKYFIDNKIVVNGSFTYKLKNIAKALFNHQLIETNWADNEIDGLSATLYGWYDLTNQDKSNVADTLHYNMIDCKVMYDIIKFIKKVK
tara:strand:+ start:28925 stop:31087 length:2163 start_codon:yes stop_codon:yes gene_type:complete